MPDALMKLNDATVDSIAELQRRATRGTTFTNDREPSDVYFISKPDGDIQRIVAEPKPLADKLATPHELASYIRDLDSRGRKPADGIVRVFPTEVDYRFAFADGRNRAFVPLVKTPAFAAVEALAGQNYQGVMLTQVDVYRLLRVTLKGSLPANSVIANVIREVKFENGATISSAREQSKKNLGIAITGAAKGANDADIPESFSVTLSVFENFVSPVMIEIDIDPIPDAAKFRLTPYPGQIEAALRSTLANIRNVYDTSTSDNSDAPLCAAYIAQ
jgi:hypothetical protein